MRAKFLALLFCLSAVSCLGQLTLTGAGSFGSGFTPITADGSFCTGINGTVATCSSALTVTAGDTITCEGYGEQFGPGADLFSDPINGYYDNVYTFTIHPTFTGSSIEVAVFQNSVGGSITPSLNATNQANPAIACQAWKGTRTTNVLDIGVINQLNVASTASANPTSGTAAAPSNANEVILCQLGRAAAATTSSGTNFLPVGTLTGLTAATLTQYFEYFIQTTATAENCPFTSASAQFVDAQFALLNASSPAGARALTGMYGAPAVAQTNGSSVTAASLNTATNTLSSVRNAGWVLNAGTAATYDTTTGIPTGNTRLLVGQVFHTLGDAGTSIKFPGGPTTLSDYEWVDDQAYFGSPMWLSSFMRVSSVTPSDGDFCDSLQIIGGAVDPNTNLQLQYSTTTGLGVGIETFFSGGNGDSSGRLNGFGLDSDNWVQIHGPGVNDRWHEIKAYSKSGGVWSLFGTLQYDVLCAFVPSGGSNGCTVGPPTVTTASGTGSASSGSIALTVTGITGTIAVGNVVLASGILDPSQSHAAWTTVAAVSGGNITLSQKTSGLVNSTVNFYTAPSTMIGATNGTVSAGSKALTIVGLPSGTIAVGDPVGGLGIGTGNFVATVNSQTSFALAYPAAAALNSTGVTFWQIPNVAGVKTGRFSSCNLNAPNWGSAVFYDPTGTYGAFAPN